MKKETEVKERNKGIKGKGKRDKRNIEFCEGKRRRRRRRRRRRNLKKYEKKVV